MAKKNKSEVIKDLKCAVQFAAHRAPVTASAGVGAASVCFACPYCTKMFSTAAEARDHIDKCGEILVRRNEVRDLQAALARQHQFNRKAADVAESGGQGAADLVELAKETKSVGAERLAKWIVVRCGQNVVAQKMTTMRLLVTVEDGYEVVVRKKDEKKA